MNPMVFMILAAERELKSQQSIQTQDDDISTATIRSSASQFTLLRKIYNKVTSRSRLSCTLNASEANCCSTVKVSSKA
jgi:hypothetical protein